MRSFKGVFAFFVLIIMLPFLAEAQKTVRVSGKVVDKKTGETLIGANIQINKDSEIIAGTSTDFDGNYLMEVPAGTYSMLVTYVSYQQQELNNLELTERDYTFDFIMEEEGLTLGEVVVTAQKTTNTEAALVTIQRKSFNIQDGLSSQQIGKTAVSNAAEAVKQVSGAVVENGKFIVMRGLGDRYSISQLNGMTMPSTDPYRNSSSLDLIPAQMIENIITLKTFTPDLPGNFSGGLVNVATKSFPSKFTVYLGISASYNTQATGISNFLGHGSDAGKTDWLGLDDGGRAIPSVLLDEKNRSLLNQTTYLNARRNDANYDGLRRLLNESSRGLSNVFAPEFETPAPNHGINFSLGNSHLLGKTTIGYSFGVNYSNEFTHYDNGQVNTYTNNGVALFEYQKLIESKSVETPHLGAIGNLSVKFGSNHAINFNAIYNNDTDIVGRRQSGSFVGQLSTPNGIFNTNSLEFISRNYTSLQSSGRHVFPGLGNLEIQWNGLLNKSKQEEPDSRYFAYVEFEEDGETFYGINDAEFRAPFHFFRDLGDDAKEAKVDFTLPFLTGGKQGSSNVLKAGVLYSTTSRSFSEYQFQHTRHGGVPVSINFDSYKGNYQGYFSLDNMGVIDTIRDASGNTKQYTIGYHYINQINNKNFYTGSQDIAAGYLMAVYSVTDKLKLVGGVRAERTQLYVESRDTTLKPSELDITDFLYSGNIIYALTDKSNLRLAATKTLARPNLRELAPFEQFDTKNGFFNIGNPNLKRTIIQNYDIRYEIYPDLGELIAVSLFYKNFSDPILRTFSPTATIPELGYLNIDEAAVYGAELELRKNLGFVGNTFKNFYFTTNLALIRSEYKIPEAEIKASKTVDPAYDQTVRPFQGQAPFIVNAILSYANQDLGLESSVAFNVSGRRLYNISLSAVPDVYEAPFPLLTYTISKKLGDHIQLGFSAKNLLNPANRKLQINKGIEYVAEEFLLGRTFGFNVAYFVK
jgi:outer membrane receptor protein involved in Fe transport